ncbi:uncharacterized protein IWZ02DRAFT_460533 [Phyllosticta citriasiana]|uniref:uncharacterized protein n=1 Tax=Phyllosticta citriasiana TaxID=595635 RepID=UPI0030FD59FB
MVAATRPRFPFCWEEYNFYRWTISPLHASSKVFKSHRLRQSECHINHPRRPGARCNADAADDIPRMSTRSASGAWTLSCHTARASSIETDCSPYSHVKRPNASLLFSSFGGGCFLRVCVLMCFKIYCSHPLLLSPRATACRHKPHLILTGRCKMQNEFCTRCSQAPLQYNHRFDRPWMLQALQAFVLYVLTLIFPRLGSLRRMKLSNYAVYHTAVLALTA